MAVVAVSGFEIEPRRYSVLDVAGTEFSRSAMPKPADHTNSPSCTTAAETPGVWLSVMNFEMAFSILACFSAASFPVELLCHSRLAETQEATHTLPRRLYLSGAAVRHQCSVPFDSCLTPPLSRCLRPTPRYAILPLPSASVKRSHDSSTLRRSSATAAVELRCYGHHAARSRTSASTCAPPCTRAARDLGDHSSLPRSDAAYANSVKPDVRPKTPKLAGADEDLIRAPQRAPHWATAAPRPWANHASLRRLS